MEPARYPQTEEWMLKMLVYGYIDTQWDFTLSLRRIKFEIINLDRHEKEDITELNWPQKN